MRFATLLMPQATQDPRCRLRVTVLDETSSPDGGKKVRRWAGVRWWQWGLRPVPARVNPAAHASRSLPRFPRQVKLIGVMVVEGGGGAEAVGLQVDVFAN